MKARVTVTLKPGVLDPQGLAISGSLKSLGFDGINSVRQGKVFDIDMAEADPVTARAFLTSMCERLLTNTVIENYAIEVLGSAPISAVWPSTQAAAAVPAAAPLAAAPTAAPPAVQSPEPETVDEEEPDVVEAELPQAQMSEPKVNEFGDADPAVVAEARDVTDDPEFSLDAGLPVEAEVQTPAAEPEPDAAPDALVWPEAHEGVAFDIAAAIANVTAVQPSAAVPDSAESADDAEGATEKPQP